MRALAALVDCSMHEAELQIELVVFMIQEGLPIDESIEARRRVNPWVRATPEELNEDIASLRAWLASRNLIEAIKLVRMKCGASLAEAKRFVEGLRDGRFESGHMPASLDHLLSRFAEPVEGRIYRETIEQAARRHAKDRTREDGVRLLRAWLRISSDDARAMLGIR
ncbi:MAG: hypothetical protein JNK05_24775 [Myxococcales bacterium]|nr:hypothetical protein [Myxococcales bacterium]